MMNNTTRIHQDKNTDGTNSNTNTIPVSLGKPSLRRRVEAYYSLVNPASIEDPVKWRQTLDQIYEKYGGTYAGERTLASKLAKKYGSSQVRLLLAESTTTGSSRKGRITLSTPTRDESWYELGPTRSGVVTMTSDQFDPVAALRQSTTARVEHDNPWIPQCPVLNCIDQFRSRLPANDPLYRDETGMRRRKSDNNKNNNTAGTTSKRNNSNNPFAGIADHLPTVSPCWQMMHRLWEKRQRVRVLIRYVNGIRGTLTGYLMAFDKHYNMILQDVEEVYHPRVTTTSACTTVGKSTDSDVPGKSWSVRKRHMKQLLVRGDNVVLVYKADVSRQRHDRDPGRQASRKNGPSKMGK